MCSICSFQRTSEIQLPLLERVEVGQGVVDEVCREPHGGATFPFLYLRVSLVRLLLFRIGGSTVLSGFGVIGICRVVVVVRNAVAVWDVIQVRDRHQNRAAWEAPQG